MPTIDRIAMMDLLLAACPSFGPQWQEFQEEWADTPDELPCYLALADFVRHLRYLTQVATYGPANEFAAPGFQPSVRLRGHQIIRRRRPTLGQRP